MKIDEVTAMATSDLVERNDFVKREGVERGLHSRQFSLRSLLIAFPLVGLALAYPGFGFFALAILPFSLLLSVLYILVAAGYWMTANDRASVTEIAWRNIRSLILLNCLFITYLVYACCYFGSLNAIAPD